ncbi:ABC transporter ATP-binding protein [Bacillus horti]|uniref:ABC-type dipeptide/oligopeptide/nickel transport system ATPase component n=1 Tax=Caldalkalibacillus horti TaxID=77523 RepID=A0ABT9VZV7_9BACI|nr:ABC transporter ATP-binding protein [Bacillus horti]MDQ0166518.1 ABC-type dipeptide/oligopeptide/nickel transport system ATPase component [Bacillus horti]
MSELLKVSDLSVRLKHSSRAIVQPISFALRTGRVLAIVGESGSGKTLTCKALMQLLDTKKFVLSGSIQFKGKELLSMAEKDIHIWRGKKIAMVVQNPMTAFNPTIRIGSQIVETIRAHQKLGKKEAYAAGIRALERMNLPRCEQLMNSYPDSLSGGMLQRIIIALSLIHDPDILIADEATTALDVKNQNLVLEEFEKIKSSGIGILLVTHDFGVVAKLADDMIVMRQGEIIERGTVFDIFSSPKEKYTKKLLEASNLTRGEAK